MEIELISRPTKAVTSSLAPARIPIPAVANKNQRVIFAALDAFAVEIVERAENRERRGDDHDHMDENAE